MQHVLVSFNHLLLSASSVVLILSFSAWTVVQLSDVFRMVKQHKNDASAYRHLTLKFLQDTMQCREKLSAS